MTKMNLPIFYLFVFCAALSSLFFTGCSTTSKLRSSGKGNQIQKSNSVLAMENQRRLQEERRQDKKDQGRLLQRKTSLQVTPQNRNMKLEVLPGDSAISLGRLTDVQLYGELVNRFERNDEFGFQSRFRIMSKKFPRSPLMDDAYYLSGLQQVGIKNYGMALKNFDQVAKNFPYSNRRVSALFAKGAVYRKMNFDPLAKTIFKEVLAKYPGSPEALRAQTELRLIR